MPGKLINLIDQKFGKLLVIGISASRGNRTYWSCICDCGRGIDIDGHHLRSGRRYNCGICDKDTLNLTHPDLCNQWHPTLNGDKLPENFTSGSDVKIWWQCLTYPEDIFLDAISSRTDKRTYGIGNIGCKNKIKFQHLVCGYVWGASPHNILHCLTGCPRCQHKNEKILSQTLDKLGIPYDFQHKVCIENSTRAKRIDFYIPSINIAIEYNGAQHYKPVIFGGGSKELAEKAFRKQQERDASIRSYCSMNNIFLLEIDGRRYKGEKLKQFTISFFAENYPNLIQEQVAL